MKGRPRKQIQEGYCWCSRCQQEYLEENFYNDKSRGNGKKSVCIDCDNELRRLRRLKDGHDYESIKTEDR